MLRKKITDNYSVSEQISLDDVDALAESGVTLIICNRPDGEEEGQLPFADVAAYAEEKNIKAKHIPFAGGQMTASDITAFQAAIQNAENVHAYCRTGNRSSQIWQAAQDASTTETPIAQDDKAPSKEDNKTTAQYDVVVVGAGSAGISTAASLLKRKPGLKICLIDPAESHFYQPGWTLVGGGVFKAANTRRNMSDVIPAHTKWLKEAVKTFLPNENQVVLENGQKIAYQYLVVAAGIKLNWDAIEGLSDTLGRNGVTSNYRYDLAPYTWELVKNLNGGKAVFTQPPMPIKCAGAPQKAMYLSCDHWLKNDKQKDINVSFYNAGAVLFGVPEYVPALESYIQKYQVNTHFTHNLVKVDGPNKRAYFATTNKDGEKSIVETEFDMLHVCPPQTAPNFIRNSPLVDAAGWVDVDKETLQHTSFKNIWSLGDVSNTPNAKTMAAARKQAPVVAQNIADAMDGNTIRAIYDGYGSCPLTVERGKIVLAEFGYGGKLLPTFPTWLNDGTKPTYLAWVLKEDLLPPFYWHGMLKGYEWFVKPTMRK
ncbi:bifunctional protein tyrosine phosphatase family protein/NAD(P)/FAD-dependent oxidoreductase [Marinomonas sp. BSi20584]|uniref:bifunctional protein tyrosine phosphatase family protein/NAD(P)/FAD-dependent oxidoreductase n=1 Tax=Marinomonas sp. BSi20584 TaxID=1594462 RepID=UPI000C1EE377|nr:bifunctional protein tyrosine phosphatase family protein/NAD(P)/FAD-dependent oxidoreductase [Marinomonas sp. BSi20584]PJE54238.1 NAD(FAD)-dependent dehydrogenase [Marinomonas sp. BSi20584]